MKILHENIAYGPLGSISTVLDESSGKIFSTEALSAKFIKRYTRDIASSTTLFQHIQKTITNVHLVQYKSIDEFVIESESLANGMTLKDLLIQLVGTLNPAIKRRYMHQLLHATLIGLHANGISHQRISLANIFFGSRGQLLLYGYINSHTFKKPAALKRAVTNEGQLKDLASLIVVFYQIITMGESCVDHDTIQSDLKNWSTDTVFYKAIDTLMNTKATRPEGKFLYSTVSLYTRARSDGKEMNIQSNLSKLLQHEYFLPLFAISPSSLPELKRTLSKIKKRRRVIQQKVKGWHDDFEAANDGRSATSADRKNDPSLLTLMVKSKTLKSQASTLKLRVSELEESTPSVSLVKKPSIEAWTVNTSSPKLAPLVIDTTTPPISVVLGNDDNDSESVELVVEPKRSPAQKAFLAKFEIPLLDIPTAQDTKVTEFGTENDDVGDDDVQEVYDLDSLDWNTCSISDYNSDCSSNCSSSVASSTGSSSPRKDESLVLMQERIEKRKILAQRRRMEEFISSLSS